jgi:plastocyanin
LCAGFAASGSLAGCGDDEDSAGSDRAATPTPTKEDVSAPAASENTLDATGEPRNASIKIALRDTDIVPEYLTVLPGQTLVFTNEDDVPHRITARENAPRFAPKTLANGQSFKLKLDKDAIKGVEGYGIDYGCVSPGFRS